MNNPVQNSSPYFHQHTSVAYVMRQVIYALIPGILLSTWYLGWGVLIQCLIAIFFALMFESFMLYIRKLPLDVYLVDGSAIITALLFALSITPFAPWWISLLGMAFAIIIVKHLYGGLGYNMFNPAMAGYVFVLLCFPAELNFWPSIKGIAEINIDLSDTLIIIFTGQPLITDFDSISSATPLGYMKSQLSGMAMISEIRVSPLFGSMGGRGWEIIAWAWVAGGIWLLINKIIKLHMPTIFILTIFATSLLFFWYSPDIYVSPIFHLFTGGILLAAFFIITDPVSAPTTPRGQIIFAAGIAIITYAIRTWGGYPDGIAFAVLIMNAAVPLLDTYTRPEIFGEQ